MSSLSRLSRNRTTPHKKGRGSPALPLVFVVVALLLALLDRAGTLQPAQGLALRLVQPAERWLTGLGTGVQDIFSTLGDLRSLRQQNAELRQQVEHLTIENVRLNEELHDYELTRQLLGFAVANPAMEVRGSQIVGRIISRDPLNYIDSIQIDLGTQQDIAIGMPVVTERGLVGRITEVYARSSKALLITDPNSAVSAFIQNSRLPGVIKGQAGTTMLLLDRIPQNTTVNVGDIVLTSGLGGNFPRGLVIGQVVSVRQRDYEMFQQAQVRPTVDFERMEMVLVVAGFPQSEDITDTSIEEAVPTATP